jgi:hypothetical protein
LHGSLRGLVQGDSADTNVVRRGRLRFLPAFGESTSERPIATGQRRRR